MYIYIYIYTYIYIYIHILSPRQTKNRTASEHRKRRGTSPDLPSDSSAKRSRLSPVVECDCQTSASFKPGTTPANPNPTLNLSKLQRV